MRAAWARGSEWWRQHGHMWRLAAASTVVWGVGQSIALWMIDPWGVYLPLLGACVLLGWLSWAYWFALLFVGGVLFGRRDLRRLRRFTTGWLLLTGVSIAPAALVMQPILERFD